MTVTAAKFLSKTTRLGLRSAFASTPFIELGEASPRLMEPFWSRLDWAPSEQTPMAAVVSITSRLGANKTSTIQALSDGAPEQTGGA